jgi:hypothetical protein
VKPAAKSPIASDASAPRPLETTAKGTPDDEHAEGDDAAADHRHGQPPPHLLELAIACQRRAQEEVVWNDSGSDEAEDQDGPTDRNPRHQQASQQLTNIGPEANGGDEEGHSHDSDERTRDTGDPLCVSGRQQQGRRPTSNRCEYRGRKVNDKSQPGHSSQKIPSFEGRASEDDADCRQDRHRSAPP